MVRWTIKVFYILHLVIGLRFTGHAVWTVQESTNDTCTDIMLQYIFHIEDKDSQLTTIKKHQQL